MTKLALTNQGRFLWFRTYATTGTRAQQLECERSRWNASADQALFPSVFSLVRGKVLLALGLLGVALDFDFAWSFTPVS